MARRGEQWNAGGGREGGGGFRDAWRRALSIDNPMGASLPVGRVAGITIRLHIIFVLYIIIELITSATQGWLASVAIGMALLFFIVLLHEFGHCFACRWVGGEADEVLLWPLGGLAYCRPPHHWRADFITTAGGPMVNVLLVPVSAACVWAAVGMWDWDLFIFNPFRPSVPLGMLASWWARTAWWFYYINLSLLAFNALLPMYPMDGGRLWQALLWRKIGYQRSMLVATNVGFFAAIALGLFGATIREPLLLGIAVFGGFTCWQQRQRVRFMSTAEAADDDPYGLFRRPTPDPGEERSVRSSQRAQERSQKEQEELDRILAKIARDGMASLSWGEKRFLRKDTARRQSGG